LPTSAKILENSKSLLEKTEGRDWQFTLYTYKSSTQYLMAQPNVNVQMTQLMIEFSKKLEQAKQRAIRQAWKNASQH